MSTRPSANWLALQKSLVRHGHPRKRRKIDRGDSPSTSVFPRDTSSSPPERRASISNNGDVDLETTEVKNGESIAALRRMVLGKLEYKTSQTAPGKYLAIDCEMVGVGIEGSESSLARVSIVNYAGAVILDVFVRQREKVVDYRTQWSGVRSTDLASSAKLFKEVQQTVADLIKDRILVGHAIHNDLKALLLSHPSPQIRDTQSLAYKHRVVKSRRPALRILVKQELGIAIQGGEHSSVTDARATMALFRLYKKQWESGFSSFRTLAYSLSKNKVDNEPSERVIAPNRPSLTLHSSLMADRKWRHPDLSKSGDEEVDGIGEPSILSSPTHSPSPSAPHDHPSTEHTSSLPKHRKQSKSRPPAQQKGISSGISTVTKRLGGIKEVRRTSTRTWNGGENKSNIGNNLKGGKVGKDGEKWWKSLGGGKKGSIKL